MHIGLDFGTTAAKGVVIDDTGVVFARASVAYDTIRLEAGYSEQDPSQWIRASRKVLAELAAEAPGGLRPTRSLGLSGQMHSLVGLDKQDRPVRRAILWNDVRGSAQCDWMRNRCPGLATITGVAAMPSFTAAKLLWIRENEPDTFLRIRQVLLPKDFVRLWMTGEKASDMSDAAGTQLFDQAKRAWSRDMLHALDLDPGLLPPLLEGTAVAGALRSELAFELGLNAGVPVICGGGDTAASAVGLGCAAAQSGFVSLGTSAVYFVAQDRFRLNAHETVHNFASCTPNRWYQMAAMLNGGSALAWASRLLGTESIDMLLDRVERRFTKPSPAMFLPYLDGERTPHASARLRGAFFGLSQSTDALDIAQAVLEGVACSIRQADDLLRSGGVRPGLVGGGSRSRLWGRIIATLIGRSLARFGEAEFAGAMGAARLAAMNGNERLFDQVATPVGKMEEVEPFRELKAAYEDRFVAFKNAFPAVAAYGVEAVDQVRPEFGRWIQGNHPTSRN
jgi:xylulokinase